MKTQARLHAAIAARDLVEADTFVTDSCAVSTSDGEASLDASRWLTLAIGRRTVWSRVSAPVVTDIPGIGAALGGIFSVSLLAPEGGRSTFGEWIGDLWLPRDCGWVLATRRISRFPMHPARRIR